jgi:hypothetical protein
MVMWIYLSLYRGFLKKKKTLAYIGDFQKKGYFGDFQKIEK